MRVLAIGQRLGALLGGTLASLLLGGCEGGGSDRVSAPPSIEISGPDMVPVGTRVELVATSRDRDGGAIVTRTWEQLEGPELQVSGFDEAEIAFSSPRTSESTQVVLEHCVVDDEQDRACEEFVVTLLAATDLGLLGGVRSLLDLTDADTGLPRDEASLRELRNGRFNSEDWFPQHLAMYMTALVIGHALYLEDSVIFESLELDDEATIERFDLLLESLEIIVADRSRHFPARDVLAFYHIYNGDVPQADSLSRFVLLEDNAHMYTALTLSANYLWDVDADIAERLTAIRDRLDLSLWLAPDGTLAIGTTELPVALDRVTHILSELRLPVVAARASGAISRTNFESILTSLFADSARADDAGLIALPAIGKMVEVYGPMPWLGERDSVLSGALLQPMFEAHTAAARLLRVPVSHTSAPVEQRRSVQFALSPFEGADERLEDFQDLPVIVPPGAAMATALGTEESLLNYEEVLLTVVSEVGIDATYGLASAYDFDSLTELIPESASPMYGTLETGYALAALADVRLEQGFLVDLLRREDGWDRAIREYRNLLIDLVAQPGPI